MFRLVKFVEDGVLFVCHARNVQTVDSQVKLVRYSDGKRYPAFILESGGMKELCLRKRLEEGILKAHKSTLKPVELPDNGCCNLPGNEFNKQTSLVNVHVPPVVNAVDRGSPQNVPSHKVTDRQLRTAICKRRLDFGEDIDDENKDVDPFAVSNCDSEEYVPSVDEESSSESEIEEEQLEKSPSVNKHSEGSDDLKYFQNCFVQLSRKLFTPHKQTKNDTRPQSSLIAPEENIPSYLIASEENIPSLIASEENIPSSLIASEENIPSSWVSSEENIDDPSLPGPSATAKPKHVPVSVPLGKKKSFFCPLCELKTDRFARHLERHHKDHIEVQKFMALPAKSNERSKIIAAIRKEGCFLYNTNENLNTGDLMVSRRPQAAKSRSVDHYLPCPQCRGYFSKLSLNAHFRTCGKKSSIRVIPTARSLVTVVDNKDHPFLKSTLSRMRPDLISKVAKSDPLIIALANRNCSRYVKDRHLDSLIRCKLREMARFLIAARKIDGDITDLKSCIDPAKFETLVSAINCVCQFDSTKGVYKTPSLAMAIGTALRSLADMLIVNAIKAKDPKLKETVADFITIYDMDFNILVSRTAQGNLREGKWNKEDVLPLLKDVQALHTYVKTEALDAYETLLKNSFIYSQWCRLGHALLVQLVLFNRRRTGEMQRLLIKHYNGKHGIDSNSDVVKTLSVSERILSEKYVRIEMRGKLNRCVPVLLTEDQVKQIDLLLSLRTAAGVDPSNPYVFGLRRDKYLLAGRAIRESSDLCGAERPQLLRGTKLRKQIATILQIMDMSENDMQVVADFMGHDIAIHRSHYRIPEATLQLARVSKLLVAVEGGNLQQFEGKNLKSVDIGGILDHDLDHDFGNGPTASQEVENDKSPPKELDMFISGEANACILPQESSSPAGNNSPGSDVCRKRQKKAVVQQSTPRKIYKYPQELMSPVKCRIPKVPWSTPERRAVRSALGDYLRNKTLPSLPECSEVIRNNTVLRRRTSAQLKAYINNQNRRQLR